MLVKWIFLTGLLYYIFSKIIKMYINWERDGFFGRDADGDKIPFFLTVWIQKLKGTYKGKY